MDTPEHALAILSAQGREQAKGRRATGMKVDENGKDSIVASQTNTYARPC